MTDAVDGTSFSYGADVPEPKASTLLDRLKATSKAVLEAKSQTFPIPARTDQGLAMAYGVYLSRDDYQLLNTVSADDFTLRLNLLVKLCRGLVMDGEMQHDDAGKPLTFESADLRAMVDAGADRHDAVRGLYVRDADVLRASDAVLRACGWDLAAPLDPTRA